MALNDINFTEPNCIKEYLSQNILSTKEIFFISIKFSKITLPYVSLKDLIIQVEYQNKFYRYFIFSKKPLYLPYPNNINQKNKIKIYISLNSSIIGKGSFHINKENIKAKVFNKIIKINLSKEKLNEMGLIQKKGDITEINGTIFIEGNVINKNNLIKKTKIGDWGLGIADWGLGPIPNPQSPIPNPQSPIPNPQISNNIIKILNLRNLLKNINNLCNFY
jgi:hypothetical protein